MKSVVKQESGFGPQRSSNMVIGIQGMSVSSKIGYMAGMAIYSGLEASLVPVAGRQWIALTTVVEMYFFLFLRLQPLSLEARLVKSRLLNC